MFDVVYSKKFTKNLKRLRKSGSFNEAKLEIVLNKLKNNVLLDPKYKDHSLNGNMQSFRECHVENDLLLIYHRNETLLVLLAVNIGSHSELFS